LFSIKGNKEHFWQWDLNQMLMVENEEINEVHFCNGTADCSLVCAINEGLVNVPNILLQTANDIKVYAVCGDSTIGEQLFKVRARTKPEDYVYTETEVLRYEDLEERITALEQGENIAGYPVIKSTDFECSAVVPVSVVSDLSGNVGRKNLKIFNNGEQVAETVLNQYVYDGSFDWTTGTLTATNLRVRNSQYYMKDGQIITEYLNGLGTASNGVRYIQLMDGLDINTYKLHSNNKGLVETTVLGSSGTIRKRNVSVIIYDNNIDLEHPEEYLKDLEVFYTDGTTLNEQYPITDIYTVEGQNAFTTNNGEITVSNLKPATKTINNIITRLLALEAIHNITYIPKGDNDDLILDGEV